jgi:hypothetical protein
LIKVQNDTCRNMNSSPSSPSLPSRGGSSNDGSSRIYDSPPTSPPFACDDRPCCQDGPGNPDCDPLGLQLFPGPRVPAPPPVHTAPLLTLASANGTVHPRPTTVTVCDNCVLHEHGRNVHNDINAYADTGMWPDGHKAQLRHSCIRNEMKLYWLRQGTAQPAAPASIPLVTNWPALAGP